jgi:hypothetical protein
LRPDQFAVETLCDYCGHFTMEEPLLEVIKKMTDAERRPLAYLAAFVRQRSSPKDPVHLTTENWQGLADHSRRRPVHAKAQALLEWLGSQSYGPQDAVNFLLATPAPLVDAGHPTEVRYLLEYLKEERLVNYLRVPDGETQTVHVTVAGWERLGSQGGSVQPGTCFVAMSFHPSLKGVYDLGIEPALADDCGYDPIRIDLVEHTDNINEQILAKIRTAEFMVADFTKHRQGVYFEAGFALALGKRVIWTCDEKEFKDTHFDTHAFNHILWSSAEGLREQLKNRVLALLGPGPNKGSQ